MMQGMIDCAFAGGWLMGAIALLVLLLLAAAVGALLLAGGRTRYDAPSHTELHPSRRELR